MPQLKKALDEVRIPFSKMTWSPDVPSTALGPTEYNSGANVETDVRGIRSVSGEQEILSTIPGTPTYVSSGFRSDGKFWFIVATDEGYWWAAKDNTWLDITPGTGPFVYAQNTNICEAWNGTIPFFNDTTNPPMFWPDVQLKTIVTTGASSSAGTSTITFAAQATAPFKPGDNIIITGITPTGFAGGHRVTACTTTSVSFAGTTTGPQTVAGIISGPYPQMIMYSNKLPLGISSIVYVDTATQQIQLDTTQATVPYVAGDSITITDVNNYYNGTFTVVSATTSTINYLASPGAAYPGGSVGTVSPTYSWNYNPNWQSVSANFMRLYNTPNVGNILVAGDLTATLLDGTKINYPITVQWSQAFGLDQAPLTWTPTITNVANQLEVPLRGPALDGFPCNGNFFLCSYWDTVVFTPINYAATNAPILGVKLANQGRGLLSSNCWANTDSLVYGIDARDVWVFDGQNFSGIGNERVKNWFYDNLAPEYYDRVFMEVNSQKNSVEIYFPDSSAVAGVPNKMISYRYDLDCWNPPKDVASATMTCESPIYTSTTPNLASRTIVYARGVANSKLVQTNQGYTFVSNSGAQPIASVFRRDNVKMLPDYSGKIMVHRILPEINNLDYTGLPIMPADSPTHVGSVNVKITGANSVGQDPQSSINVVVQTNTDTPWAQINQNAFRVNTIELSNTSDSNIWICNATTWQTTQVEDDR